ncbi:heavy metal translocating P-type ATPase [Acholeplasma hippikon]|uniref:Zinc-transporting ATPase n=1 Tax=Acholeplasma hippikon TaxID=264636 RepID=A0A449BI61_9MOLU|nr:heavy metal translocating P-type ATPase [Acholeplasma hippikon]VEU82144.1 Zinc-transporting ATPase [Acholeplasma hippikon]
MKTHKRHHEHSILNHPDPNLKHTHHDDDGDEHHHNLKLIVGLYFIGLGLFIISLFFRGTTAEVVLNLIAIVLSGFHVIYEGIEDTITETRKQRKFRPNVHILMTLGAIGSMIIGDFNEATLLILIFAGSHFLEDYAEGRSRREITNLLSITPKTARRIKEDGSIELIDVKDIKVKDRLQVLIGDQVPTDGVIIKGNSDINESVITGESIPVFKKEEDNVYGSSINLSNELIIEVTKDASETVIAKIIELVSQTKKNISKTAKIIKRIEPIYVNIVLIFAPIFYLMGLYLFGWGHDVSFYKTCVLLIVTSPCALAATDIPATLSSISNLAKRGVLFKGGSYLSNISDMKAIAFDKTGTLTIGKPVVVDKFVVTTAATKDISLYEKLLVSMERQSNHPLALAILNHYQNVETMEIEVENIIGVGLKTTYDNNVYTITKPAYLKDITGSTKEKIDEFSKEGKTVIVFAKNNEAEIILALQDIAKDNVKEVITYFKENGVKPVMITGDSRLTATAIANQVGIEDIYANVMPDQKQAIVMELKEKYGVTTMLGDGINDAPALTAADIGIAMKDGTDIAIDVADGVLMKNDLSKFIYTHQISKKLRRIVLENIFFSMGVVLLLLISNIIGVMDMPIAVTFHEGSTILVILNGLRMLIPLKTNIK